MNVKKQRRKNISDYLENLKKYYYKRGITKAIKTLEEMKKDDYESMCHTGFCLLGEYEWDTLISNFRRKVNKA